ncbi:MAG: ABC transporter permease [Firmicutes bacterium]|nr:ABC transporter permease [Bacillota bacterium]
MSLEQQNFLKKIKLAKLKIFFFQVLIIVLFLFIWEFLVNLGIISAFIYSSPSRIIKTINELIINNNFFIHIYTTLIEVLISFMLGISLGFIIALILYECKTLAKIVDPFLTMLNSLPKVALGPLIIIIFGANTKSIIIMALLINLIVSIITIYNGFQNTDEYRLKLFKTLNATKFQTLTHLVIPSSYQTIIASFKLCIAQTLIGVIMGEFLVSKQGIGYLIVYGKQVFNLNLVMTGIILLAFISYILYKLIVMLEKKLLKHI